MIRNLPQSLACVACVLSLGAGNLTAQRPKLYDLGKLRKIELKFHQPKWWLDLGKNRVSRTYIKADLTFLGLTYRDVGVRFRGNSSFLRIPQASTKKPFKIKMNAFVLGQDLLGYETLNLNNNYQDPGWVREVLAYEIYRRCGPAPKSNYVTLTINGENFGPYVNTQQINADLLREWFPSTKGNRYKAERVSLSVSPNDSALTWMGTAFARYQQAYQLNNPSPMLPWSDLVGLCNTLNNVSGPTFETQIVKWLDVDSALTYLALTNGLMWLDSYAGTFCHNFVLYHDKVHDRFSFLPWDPNQSFGTFTDFTSQITKLSPFNQQSNQKRPLINRLLAVPRWRAHYLAKLRGFANNDMDWPRIKSKVDAWRGLIAAEVKKDKKSLYTHQDFLDALTKNIIPKWHGLVPALKTMVEKRSTFLRAHAEIVKPFPVFEAVQRTIAEPLQLQSVIVTAKVAAKPIVGKVRLFFRVKGPFIELPMLDDGKSGDQKANDGIYGGSLPAQVGGTQVEYYLTATSPASNGGAMSFWPPKGPTHAARYRVSYPRVVVPLRINELLAKNLTGPRDEFGDREDWIEIVNTGTSEVDMSGMQLTDDLGVPMKWTFPSGTKLKAGKTLLVWADSEPNEGRLHATFKLDNDGEEVALLSAGAKGLIDFVSYPAQRADQSFGRLFDGKVPWVTFPKPSPRALNSPPGCGYRLYSSPDPFSISIDLVGQGSAKIGTTNTLLLSKIPVPSIPLMLLTPAPSVIPLIGDLHLLVNFPIIAILTLPLDAFGFSKLPLALPKDKRLVGAKLYWQLIDVDLNYRLYGSNALEMTICDG